MGTTGLSSSLTESTKSFWKKKDSIGAWVALGLIGIGVLWGWGSIAGWVLGMLLDTVHIAELGALLFGGGFILMNWRTHMAFRLLTRAITSLFTTLDPIGVVKDHLLEMKKRRDVMNEQIGNVRGAKQQLTDTITGNNQKANNELKLAEEAKILGKNAKVAEEQQRMILQVRLHSNNAGRLQQSNIGYSTLLVRITSLYDILTKWSTNVDFFISDTEDTINQAVTTKKVTDKAFGAFREALNVFRGNAAENDVYDEAMSHMAEEASMKLGQMEDIQRITQNVMDTIDVQNGAANTDAMAQLDKYEQKLLTTGDQSTAFLLPTNTGIPEKPKVEVATGKNYDDYFRQ